MAQCIYCLEDKSPEHFRKAEHVMPQSFGKFQGNFTLHGVVCDSCNQYLGDTLELALARDTLEGHLRVEHGVRRPEEFKAIRKSRVGFKVAEGEFEGCHAYREYSEEAGQVIVLPFPQVGFLLAPSNKYEYFLLDDIPSEAELQQKGFDSSHPMAIRLVPYEQKEMIVAKLAERGILFRLRGEIAAGTHRKSIEIEVSGTIDDPIWRAVAKIAFNYLAHSQGAAFALHPAFNPLRYYIRYGKKPDFKLVDAREEAILDGEPIEGSRYLGHLVTTNIAADGASIISQVALFNRLTYLVSLARDFPDELPQSITQGHFFDTDLTPNLV